MKKARWSPVWTRVRLPAAPPKHKAKKCKSL